MTLSAQPLVSVLMPVRNAGAYLAKSLASMWAQELSSIEVIVVDDGSTDDTLAVLDRQKDSRLRVASNNAAVGVAGALNTGLVAARGRYIARMDGDDLSLPSRLAVQVRLLERHDDVAVVGSDIQYMTAAGIPTRRRTRLPRTPEGVRLHLHIGNCLPHPTVVARRSALEAAGGYRTDRPGAEDYDLWLRLMGSGRFMNVPTPLLLYRVHAANTSTMQQRHGADSVATPIAEALSALLGRDVAAAVVQRLLLPSAPVGDVHELARAVVVVREVVALAARGGRVPHADLCSLRRRRDEVLARLHAAALRTGSAEVGTVLRAAGPAGTWGAVRGLAETVADRARSLPVGRAPA